MRQTKSNSTGSLHGASFTVIVYGIRMYYSILMIRRSRWLLLVWSTVPAPFQRWAHSIAGCNKSEVIHGIYVIITSEKLPEGKIIKNLAHINHLNIRHICHVEIDITIPADGFLCNHVCVAMHNFNVIYNFTGDTTVVGRIMSSDEPSCRREIGYMVE